MKKKIITVELPDGLEARPAAMLVQVGGGFGYKMNVKKAIEIGLFPEACADKIISIGNSCLKGLVKSLRDSESEAHFEEIVNSSKEIELSSNKKFQEFYVEYMMF